MLASRKKIHKGKDAEPYEFEDQALYVLLGNGSGSKHLRRILRPPKKGSAAQCPRNHTLTLVHESLLDDIVLPAEIVGKHMRYRMDGSKVMKVGNNKIIQFTWTQKSRTIPEYKLESFYAVYRKLAGKDVVFEYPITTP
ncbi:hypothetical protein SAY86_023750 [Trapa natans]|uniref:40S ribosomal protein S7 n=1 Tax=Trapa natans TaxID=22666 RepID=A0AAN7MB79_TRANT|nr:hypothetical protein SAY86_023750 [Trapa natans]